MRSPLWILTSILFSLCVLVAVFILMTGRNVPSRASLRIQSGMAMPLKDVSRVNVARIYENDLFNTYIAPESPKAEKEVAIKVPNPPMPQAPAFIQKPRPQFFDPLDIALKGVIFSYDDKDNRVIIADNKTKIERLYKVGDRIEDADIVHIGKNKVVFLRSNGQQETVFITQAEAQTDPVYTQDVPWSLVVKRVSDFEYALDPSAFIKRFASPAQFLDMLDLTTAFEKGRSVGLRVGKMDQRSIGHSLGLLYGDIIESVQGIATTSTQDRVAIFEKLKMQSDNAITVVVRRGQDEITLTFVMKKLDEEEGLPRYGEKIAEDMIKTGSLVIEEAQASQREQIVAQRGMPAQSLKLAKKQDRHVMVNRGGRSSILQRMPADKPIV